MLVWSLVGKIPWRRKWQTTPVFLGFPCGSAGKAFACNAGDLGLIPGLGRSPGDGKGYSLQFSGLENSMDCIVHGVTNSRKWLSNFHFHFFPVAAVLSTLFPCSSYWDCNLPLKDLVWYVKEITRCLFINTSHFTLMFILKWLNNSYLSVLPQDCILVVF